MKKEKIIYHIAFTKDWGTAQKQGFYEVESIQSEGFIHASLSHQVLNSANLFFKNQDDLLLLAILSERVNAPIQYENTTGGTELFPHIYGVLNLDAIVEVQDLDKDDNGNFVMPKFEFF